MDMCLLASVGCVTWISRLSVLLVMLLIGIIVMLAKYLLLLTINLW